MKNVILIYFFIAINSVFCTEFPPKKIKVTTEMVKNIVSDYKTKNFLSDKDLVENIQHKIDTYLEYVVDVANIYGGSFIESYENRKKILLFGEQKFIEECLKCKHPVHKDICDQAVSLTINILKSYWLENK